MKRTRKKHDKLYTIFIVLQGAVIFMAIFLAIVIFANWNAVANELAFSFGGPKTTPSPKATPTAHVVTPVPIVEPAHIIIDKIGVNTPLNWDVPASQTIEYLNKGVAHLAGTARLGEVGNVFITGHSSDYVWKQNPYAAVFSLLPKLAAGDTVKIRENGKEYVYKVVETKIVKPTQVEVTKATTTPVLTLMTCYPIGSTKERYIVHAVLVSSPEKPVARDQQSIAVPEIKFR